MVILYLIGLGMMVRGWFDKDGLMVTLGLGLWVLCMFSQCMIIIRDEDREE